MNSMEKGQKVAIGAPFVFLLPSYFSPCTFEPSLSTFCANPIVHVECQSLIAFIFSSSFFYGRRSSKAIGFFFLFLLIFSLYFFSILCASFSFFCPLINYYSSFVEQLFYLKINVIFETSSKYNKNTVEKVIQMFLDVAIK